MKSIKQILIVEDDPINLFLFKKFLSNYDCESASNSDDTFFLLDDSDYKVILMDINLGHNSLDGTALLKIIKERNLTQAKIIACTAYAEKGDRDRFLSEGFDAYLSKPIKKEELQDLVKDFIAS